MSLLGKYIMRFKNFMLIMLLLLGCSIQALASSPEELFKLSLSGDEKAFATLKREASNEKNYQAKFQLGRVYSHGTPFLKSDQTKAAEWVLLAAKGGDVLAQFNMGYLYKAGRGVEKNLNESYFWTKKAAEAGDEIAQFNLALLLNDNEFAEKNEKESFYWMKQSAEKNNASAQSHLGMMYGLGIGVEASDKKALSWYKKAAENGDLIAMTNIGYMYLNGDGVEVDLDESYFWLSKPSKRGDHRAIKAFNYVCRKINKSCEY